MFGNGNLPPAAAAATAVDPVSKLADLVSLWFSNAGRSGDFPVAKLFILGNVLKSPCCLLSPPNIEVLNEICGRCIGVVVVASGNLLRLDDE